MSEMEGVSRVLLKDAVPLDTPLSLQMFIAGHCNFRCVFCAHSMPMEQTRALGIKPEPMKYSLFKKIVDQLRDFPRPLKMINVAGIGEPTLHPELARMVRCAAESGVAERVEVVTNAALLTPGLSDALIDAGLGRLRVSIEGLSDEEYARVCGARQPGIFERIVKNLRYFYEHKTDTAVYVKTVDIVCDTDEKREKFMKIFTPVSDNIGIEYIAPMFPGVDYKSIKNDYSHGMRGNSVIGGGGCPSPFYTVIVESTGDVAPCCHYPFPIIYGNVLETSMREIWDGERRRTFLRSILSHEAPEGCRDCGFGMFLAQPEDEIKPSDAEAILKRI